MYITKKNLNTAHFDLVNGRKCMVYRHAFVGGQYY